MSYVRTALFLDFDNVFSGLCKLDPQVAVRFASDPGAWLRRLSTTLVSDAPRRWLVLRCYLNPSGWAQSGADKVYFSQYRQAFVQAGFEVVDCPRYTAMKNGADVKIVIDALDALAADPPYQEFVIASGDSDLTPLLQRLRRADRRILVMPPAYAAEAFTSVADQVLDSHQLLALVQGEPIDLDDDIGFSVGPDDRDRAYESFRTIVTAEYESASEPLNMAALAQRLRDDLGDAITRTGWFGYGAFARAVQSLDLPHLVLSQHELWDESRHQAPEPAAPPARGVVLPEPLERLHGLVNLPRLPREWWPSVYGALSDYARSHTFSMTECTAWARDRLSEQGLGVSRRHIGFVMNGSAYGGCPLYRDPPPTAAEIGAAFVGNLIARAAASELTFSDAEIQEIRDWLGEHREDAEPSAFT